MYVKREREIEKEGEREREKERQKERGKERDSFYLSHTLYTMYVCIFSFRRRDGWKRRERERERDICTVCLYFSASQNDEFPTNFTQNLPVAPGDRTRKSSL